MPMRRASASQAATSARPTPRAVTSGRDGEPAHLGDVAPQDVQRAVAGEHGPASVSTSATKKSRRFSKMFGIGRTSILP
jgi:hypothetical protein